MNLHKVKLWIKDNEWRESLILSESEQEAINKAMSEVSEEYLIDLICIKVDDEKVKILNQLIKEHEENNCCCDLTEGGYGLCLAGAYLEGCVSLEDTLRDIEGDE